MKFYSFLKFILLLGAFANIVQALQYITGSIYEPSLSSFDDTPFFSSPELVYGLYPELKPLDVALGVIMIVFAIFQVYVSSQLKYKTRRAPKLAVATYIILPLTALFYNICVGYIIGNVSGMVSGNIFPILLRFLFAILVKTYFAKRKFMFVN